MMGIGVNFVEIGNVSQPAGQVAVNVQPNANQAIDEKKVPTDAALSMQKDFEVKLDEGLKAKLADFTALLQNREQLIKALPENIRKAVMELLQQASSNVELSQGLSSLLTGQKNIAEQLKGMSNLLEFAAALQEKGNGDLKAFVQKVIENVTGQLTKNPEQPAKELLQLAKQLSLANPVLQGDFKQGTEEYLQAKLPETMQQLSENDQKNINQLTKLLAKEMPATLQQLAQKNNLPELPGIWSALKAVEASPFKDVQPKTLQAAADLLRQIAQEMSTGNTTDAGELEQFIKNLPTEVSGKAAVGSPLEQLVKKLPAEANAKAATNVQLEQFLKTLPPEISKALQQVLKQANLPVNLRALADTFSNAAVLNEHMTSDQQSFTIKLAESFAAKSPSMPAETSGVLTQLAAKFSDASSTLEQIKLLIKQLKTEFAATDPKILEPGQDSLEQLTKLLDKQIPPALQEAAAKHKLEELPKMWALLKGMEAEQWQKVDQQTLQKSASLVKELAQSIYKSPAATGEKQAEHSILSFSVPLQVAAGVYYPAHIHIYHEEKNEESGQSPERQFETWLRICVDTENIGMVDAVFRLYDENQLDVRVTFPSTAAAEEFSQDLPNIRKSLDENNLSVTEIMINHG